MLINPHLDYKIIIDHIEKNQKNLSLNSEKFSIYNGAMIVEDFLTPQFRQLLEGQIYSYGKDIGKIYKSTRAPHNVGGELSIPQADIQIAQIEMLKQEIMVFLSKIFKDKVTEIDFQLRELPPNSSGHPRHVDYEKGFTKIKGSYLVPISMSLPITDHHEGFVEFIMEGPKGTELVQTKAGSLAIFGPQIFHRHPTTDKINEPSLWLIIGAFLEINLK